MLDLCYFDGGGTQGSHAGLEFYKKSKADFNLLTLKKKDNVTHPICDAEGNIPIAVLTPMILLVPLK